MSHIYHPLLLQLLCPLGDKQIPGAHSPQLLLPVVIAIAWSHVLPLQIRVIKLKRGQQVACARGINSYGHSRGPVSYTFAWHIRKQGNKWYTIFAVVLEFRMISAASYFLTGILGSEHFGD